tara:strand:+ start:679 stop:945 length:267 start_codon:yes stop_codon:yes gene_type:complete
MPNPFKKTQPLDEPYAVYKNDQRGWEWRILATRKMPENEAGSPFAIWYVAAKSPFTYGDWEYADTYKSEVIQNGQLVTSTNEWSKHYG